jgi:DNA-directed RNA polymerase subunit H (RpoH/RPB5)
MNTNLRQYTWRRKNNISTASRIDYFLISTDIRPRIVSADIRPATISYTDHQAISLKINHKAESRGRGYFKLNSKILENEEYKEIIKQLISKYQEKPVIQKTDPRTLWDVFKAEVRDVTVKICKQISHEKNYELNKLEKTLQSLQLEQDNEKNKVTKENAKSLQDKINVIENKLSKIYSDKAKGAQIRSRIKWVEEGEKNTKFFLGLEKARQTRKNITALKDNKGKLIKKQLYFFHYLVLIVKIEEFFLIYSVHNFFRAIFVYIF